MKSQFDLPVCPECGSLPENCKCPSYWVPYNQVNYNKTQMIYFLLPNLLKFRAGEYPDEPDKYYKILPNGIKVYCECSKTYSKNRRSNEGKQVKPCTIAGDIDSRLDQTPYKHLVIAHYTLKQSINQIASTARLSPQTIEKEIRLTLNFISGWRRKSCSFQEWNLVDKILRLIR